MSTHDLGSKTGKIKTSAILDCLVYGHNWSRREIVYTVYDNEMVTKRTCTRCKKEETEHFNFSFGHVGRSLNKLQTNK